MNLFHLTLHSKTVYLFPMSMSKEKMSIASTTSIQNSGLFDILIPGYERQSLYDVEVLVTAIGTGKAIRLAKQGKADLMFTHDPFREEKFVSEGYGVNRREVMHNDFILIGPSNDPAEISKAQTAVNAFRSVANSGSPFISRGDDSGTNIREMDIWEDAGINPKGKGWYFETGNRMGDTIVAADKTKAYTLSDIGTFLNYMDDILLKILFRGDSRLRNQYSVIAVNPERFPDVQYRLAMDFIAFVTSREGQRLIAGYVKHGYNLFFPSAVPSISDEKNNNRRKNDELESG